MTVYGSANIFEVLWTLIAMIGAFVAIPNWATSVDDKRTLSLLRIDGAKLLLAKSNIRIHATVSLILLAFMQLGVVFMFTPPANTPTGVSFAGLDLSLVIIPINVWLGIWSYIERRDRSKVLAAIRREGVPADKHEHKEV